MSLGKKVFTSAFLLLFRKIWGNLINLLVMAFLARILSREDFGLLAISSVFLSIINTLATSGIAEYIVYYDGDDKQEKINAAFWLNLFLTLAVIAVVITAGPWWADFYKNEKIYSLLLLLSVSFFFEMGSTVPRAMLRKELEYKTLVYYSSVSMTVISVGKVAAAWAGFGVYSLALPQALVSPFLMLAFFLKTTWKPYARLGVAHFKTIVNYSKHIIGGRVLTKLVNEGDNLIVGKLIGMEGLGIYALAFQLANLVTTNVVFLVNDLVLPVFSKVKNDTVRLKNVYLHMLELLGNVSFPLIVVLILSAESIINVIYGEKWIDAVLPFQILCAFALSRSINSPTSSLFNAMGRPDTNFKFAIYFTPVFLLSVYFGSLNGVVGVALATTICRILGSFVLVGLALKLIYAKWSEFFGALQYMAIASMITFLMFSFLLLDLEIPYQDLIRLFIAPIILYFNILLYRLLFKQAMIRNLNYFFEINGQRKITTFIRRFIFIYDKG